MSADDLDRPLGFVPPRQAAPIPFARQIPWAAWVLASIFVAAISLMAFAYVTGRLSPPSQANVSAPLDSAPPKRIAVPDLAAGADVDSTLVTGGVRIITPGQDQEGGVKIIRRNGGEQNEALVIRVPQGVKSTTPTSSAVAIFAPDPRLMSTGPHGPLPRVAPDGTRPLDVYARSVMTSVSLPPSAPRVALVITGLGLDRQATVTAIKTLPPAITLAFASSSIQLEDQTEQARMAGHELLLQVPMEGYAPAEDLGPSPLLSNVAREKNLDALHWHMSRFPGYIGLTHLHGARVMANASAFSPLLQDVAERGLMFLDDGSSRQAMTSAVALASGAPSLRADLVLDASLKAEAQEAALRRLETLARDKGSAIAVVRFAPSAIDPLVRFAQGAEARGIALVPVSALVPAPARSSAR